MTQIFSFASYGYEGILVRVEIDIRTGIPGMEIVGLPDIAVRESRERITGGAPQRRVLLSQGEGPRQPLPSRIQKRREASFDLPIAPPPFGPSFFFPSDTESEHQHPPSW
jgi:magnesium chelatase family protein